MESRGCNEDPGQFCKTMLRPYWMAPEVIKGEAQRALQHGSHQNPGFQTWIPNTRIPKDLKRTPDRMWNGSPQFTSHVLGLSLVSTGGFPFANCET